MRRYKLRLLSAYCALWFLGVVAALAPAAVVAYFASHQNQSRKTAPSTTLSNLGEPRSLAENERNPRSNGGFPRRAIYPYSVVPGGIHSSEGLREAVSRDRVVGLHYSDFNLARIHLARLKTAQSAYVSYRIGNKIYWTRRKLKLARDEEVITDGVSYARARCGNRISPTPKAPTSAMEPPPEKFDSQVDPQVAGPQMAALSGFPRAAPVMAPIATVPPVLTPGATPVGAPPLPPGFGPIPPVFILPPGKSPGHIPPPVPVPEPSTWTLLPAALTAMYAARRKKTGKSPHRMI